MTRYPAARCRSQTHNPHRTMLSPRLVTGVATILVSAVSIAAIGNLLPFQDAAPQQTKQHKLLVKSAGNYEGTTAMWMPGAPEPMQAPCSEVVTAIGGLWTTSHFQMEFMGQPFAGSAISGYDAERKKFIGYWVDSTNPKVTQMEGDWDEAKQAIVMQYDMFDTMINKMVKMRSETVHHDDGYTMTFFRIEDGKAERQMQMTMKRKATVEAGAVK